MTAPPWLTDERLRLYPRAALLAWGATVLISWGAASGAASPFGRLGGDFASFYAAGAMVVGGADATTLYDPAAQQAAQAALFPGDDAWLWFAYPAAVAVAYAPLSLIPFPTAWLLHTAAMATALYGAVRLLRPVLGLREEMVQPWFVAMLTFYPMFRSVTGGQNTALTALLVAATIRALHDGLDGRAGLASGLLCFKPQLALPVIGLQLLARRGTAPLVAVLTATGLVGVGAVVGLDWLPIWVERLGAFQSAAQQLEVYTSVGALGVAEAVLGHGPVATAFGLVASALVALVMVGAFLRDDAPTRLAALAFGLPLLPPHSLFYDAGLAALAFPVLVRGHRGGLVVGGLWALGALVSLGPTVRLQPAALALALGMGWVALSLTRPSSQPSPEAPPDTTSPR